MTTTRAILSAGIAALFVTAVGYPASAQDSFPSQPITMIVPFAPGADTDNSARLIARGMEERLGQPVVVINRTGAGGQIGFAEGAAADPDGYTITVATPSIVTGPYLSSAVRVRVLEDFEPVALPAGTPLAVITRADRPWSTAQEFLDYAAENPGEILYGNPGEGSFSHLLPLAIESATGVEFTHIAYQGGGPALVAALGGEVDAAAVGIGGAVEHIREGTLQVLAFATRNRYPAFPDTPTLHEMGHDVETLTWWGYLVPKGTPQDRVEMLADAIRHAAGKPEFLETAERRTWLTDYYGPSEFAEFLVSEDARYGGLIERMIERGSLVRAN
ncbi:MAG: tripartite tricarboxylate transporter substrate binding protein [Salinarimonadaceae bacterium]|nr:MAG: tripartite tricarboxylate transporter substrate binding protein [Salinarimonadaceae bacterium]